MNDQMRIHIPQNQLDSGQKAVDIMAGDKLVGVNVTKSFAKEFVFLWNQRRDRDDGENW